MVYIPYMLGVEQDRAIDALTAHEHNNAAQARYSENSLDVWRGTVLERRKMKVTDSNERGHAALCSVKPIGDRMMVCWGPPIGGEAWGSWVQVCVPQVLGTGALLHRISRGVPRQSAISLPPYLQSRTRYLVLNHLSTFPVYPMSRHRIGYPPNSLQTPHPGKGMLLSEISLA